MKPPYRITPVSITLVISGITYILTQDSHANYEKIRMALKNQEYDLLEQLINLPKAVEAFGQGKIQVIDGQVYYQKILISGTITRRIIEQLNEGFDINPMILFLENLLQNPSKRAVDELYDFLEACDLPITDDGCFVAYKKVNDAYMDIHSNTMDNSIGKTLTMARNTVDEDKSRTCSTGLHFCSQSYLPKFGNSINDRVVIVKINPRDVVAIPSDYKNAKGRTCEYTVIGEVDASKLKFYESSVFPVSSTASSLPVNEHQEPDVLESPTTIQQAESQVTEPLDTLARKSMILQATELGFVKDGRVWISMVNGEMQVVNCMMADANCIIRSYETKSVRAAVKIAVQRENLKNASNVVAVNSVKSTVYHFVIELYTVSEKLVASFDDLSQAQQYADEYLEKNYPTVISVTVKDESGKILYIAENESSSSEYEEDESSSEYEEDDQENDDKDDPDNRVSVEPIVFTPVNDVLFTRQQACLILGVSEERLNAMLENKQVVEVSMLGGTLIKINP